MKESVQTTSLKTLQKLEALLMELMPILRRFPKTERYTLAENIEGNFLKMIELIHQAAYEPKARLESLRQARIASQVGLFQLRLSRRQALLSEGAFERLSFQIIEIGKMLSGWIKVTESRLERGSEKTGVQKKFSNNAKDIQKSF